MAPDDDEDSEDLYDDEFDFVDDDEDDDDASDLDSEVDSDADDSADEDSDVDSELEPVKSQPDSELDDAPAPRPAAAKRNDRPAADSRDRDIRDVNPRDIDSRDRNPSDFDDPDRDNVDRDGDRNLDGTADEEPADEFGTPAPPANYLVHIYEYRQFKRTIDRPFTPEDAEAFASEYNRTSKSYGRFALAGKDDAKPKKALD